MPNLICKDHIIPYRVVRHARARNIIISVTAHGIRLTVPKYEPRKRALQFLEEKKKWVAQQYSQFRRHKYFLYQNAINGKGIPLLGRNYPVEILRNNVRSPKVTFTADAFNIHIKEHDDGHVEAEIIREALKSWYKSTAYDHIIRQVEYFSEEMKLAFNKIAVRDQKTIWGSCSARRILSFNWRLILLSPDVINYVIVHELAHLRYTKHGKMFWRLISKYVQNYILMDQSLKEYDAYLFL